MPTALELRDVATVKTKTEVPYQVKRHQWQSVDDGAGREKLLWFGTGAGKHFKLD